VDTFLLDLWTPRSLCAGSSSIRNCERDHSCVLPKGHLRLPGDGGSIRCDYVRELGCVGTPYVHRRHDISVECILHAVDHAGGVPTGIKIFNWIATLWGGRIRFTTPMLFCIGFLFQFLMAGLTGIMLSVSPWDWQLHNSYFVIAHFHYVLVGAIVFCIFAAIYFWYPKATGRLMSETLGKWHFWLFTIGFHLTFDTMHLLGLLGMPRSIYTYQPDRGWNFLNLVVSIGGMIQGLAVLIFAYNFIRSYTRGEIAGDDPWDAWTLEWTTSSPPPVYNFEEFPEVHSRRPLWDLKHPDDPDWEYEA
jgi:cytochrome c oxidase subunit 1